MDQETCVGNDAYQQRVEEERKEEEDLGDAAERADDVLPRHARIARDGDEQEVDGVKLLGQHDVGGQPLVERDEQDEVVCEPDRPEQDGEFWQPDDVCEFGADEVADDRQVCWWVGNLGEPPLAAG